MSEKVKVFGRRPSQVARLGTGPAHGKPPKHEPAGAAVRRYGDLRIFCCGCMGDGGDCGLLTLLAVLWRRGRFASVALTRCEDGGLPDLAVISAMVELVVDAGARARTQ